MKTTKGMNGVGRLAALASCVALAACAVESAEDADATTSEIRGGSTTTAHPAVGMLYYNADWTCTGTQLGPQLVLAAAHCAYSAPQSGYTVTKTTAQSAPRGMMFYPTVSSSGRYSTSGGISVDRIYAWKSSGGNADPDLALFHLASARTLTSYAAVGGAMPTTDATVTAVGYGCSSTGTGYYTKRSRALRFQTDLSAGTINQMSGLVTKTTTAAVLCPGDSGGPLYDGTYIFGIASAGDTTTSFWVDAVAMKASIDAAASVFDAPSGGGTSGASGTSVCTQGGGYYCSDASGNIPAGYASARVGADSGTHLAYCSGGRITGAITRCTAACVKAASGSADRCR